MDCVIKKVTPGKDLTAKWVGGLIGSTGRTGRKRGGSEWRSEWQPAGDRLPSTRRGSNLVFFDLSQHNSGWGEAMYGNELARKV
jgi:hypothetical protein